MKTIKCVAILCLLTAASTIKTFAVVDQTLQIQGTNLVLSWPSLGYEYYMIEYRLTLDPSTPWIQLVNNYPANSTNRTTYIIPCCTLNELMTNMGAFSGGGGFMATSAAVDSSDSSGTELWAYPKDGSGDPAPLALYPPGFDTNSLVIYERTCASARGTSLSSSGGAGSGDPQPDLTSGGCNCPDMGFFRVWHIPDWAVNVTNFTYDGPTFIPIDFKDYKDQVVKVDFLLDGQRANLADFMPFTVGTQIYWGLGIYFDRIPSGTHQVQVVSTLRLDDQADDGATLLTLSNITRSVVVDNQVTFTNWDDTVWNNTNYTFRAQLKNTNTDWQIDIYDAWGFWMNGASGHTTDGHVEWTWDLTDFNGNPRDDLSSDPFYDPWISFAAAAPGNPPTTRPTPVAVMPYPSTGSWLIAFQYLYEFGTTKYNQLVDAMYGIEGWVDYHSIPENLYPIRYGTNGPTQADRDASWSAVKGILSDPDYRNFYYLGHGYTNAIGGDMDAYDASGNVTGSKSLPGSKAFLLSSTVKNEITYNKSTGNHRYRFVWLDGCLTAGGDWPAALV